MYPSIRWFIDPQHLRDNADQELMAMLEVDASIAGLEAINGYCTSCAGMRDMTVFGGAMLGVHINLREGLVCQVCGLNARSRLVLHAASMCFHRKSRIAVLEAFTPLARRFAEQWRHATLSEYFGADNEPGTVRDIESIDGRGVRRARHEDMLRLSYANGTLDGLVHNDVLEHVSDVDRALAEAFRVLRPGGIMIFTMPWFPWLDATKVRGRLHPDGRLEEFLPTEYHGDGLRPKGIYTFYNFGADFHTRLMAAGFGDVRYGVCYAPDCGFLSNNYRYGTDGLMVPSILSAQRPA